jgi:hypothetical protein
MLTDKELYMSDAQAVTSTADSTVTINNIKDGDALVERMAWVLKVTTAFTTSDSATLAAKLQHATVSSFGDVPGMTVSATAAASLTAGAVLARMLLPIGMKANIKTVYTVGTGTFTAGKIESFLVPASALDVY